MASPDAPSRAGHDQNPSSPDPTSALRLAFTALAGLSDGARPSPGALGGDALPASARVGWLEGVRTALEGLPVLHLAVTRAGLLHAEEPVLAESDRTRAARLHDAGLRAITVFPGAPDAELATLGALLAADWPRAHVPTAEAIWAASLAHVWIDLDEPTTEGPFHAPATPVLARLEFAADPPRRLGALSEEADGALHELRATVAPEPVGLLDAGAPVAPGDVLRAEAALARAGGELDPRDLAEMFTDAIAAAADPAEVERLSEALLAVAVDLLLVTDVGPLLHLGLELTDADLTPDDERRQRSSAAASRLGEEPLLGRLVARLPAAESSQVRGSLFSLLSLVRSNESVGALAESLPRWAMKILADTVLLRDPDDPAGRLEAVRARLASPSPAVVALGLAVAARVDEPRLLEPLTALAEHPSWAVREAALVALRPHATPRVRDLARRLLDDPVADVRVEALRHAVAHRLPEALPWLEARLREPSASMLDEHEARAVCIAYGRLAREAAEAPLREIALGRRFLGPDFARHALHGLRAVGTPGARAALEHVVAEHLPLRDEAAALLGDAR